MLTNTPWRQRFLLFNLLLNLKDLEHCPANRSTQQILIEFFWVNWILLYYPNKISSASFWWQMSIEIHSTEFQSEDQPWALMAAVTSLEIGSGKREEDCLKEAFSRKRIWRLTWKQNLKDAKRVEFSVLDTQLFLLEKNYVLNFSRFFINDLSFSVSFLLHFPLFTFFPPPPILTDPWWETNDLQYQKEWCWDVYMCGHQHGWGERQWSGRADCLW